MRVPVGAGVLGWHGGFTGICVPPTPRICPATSCQRSEHPLEKPKHVPGLGHTHKHHTMQTFWLRAPSCYGLIISYLYFGVYVVILCLQVARLGVAYALMHMRGEPATMQLPENKNYPEGVCKGVAVELAHAARRAMAAGIEPWRIILDPGEGDASYSHYLRHLHGVCCSLLHQTAYSSFFFAPQPCTLACRHWIRQERRGQSGVDSGSRARAASHGRPPGAAAAAGGALTQGLPGAPHRCADCVDWGPMAEAKPFIAHCSTF